MTSRLGSLIRKTRKARGIGLRELARRIDRSASFLSRLDTTSPVLSVSSDTLRLIAAELSIDADLLIVLAGKVPEDVRPQDAGEAKLYRRLKALEPEQRLKISAFLDDLEPAS